MSTAAAPAAAPMTDLASAGDLVSLANLTPASIAHIIDVARTIKQMA